MVKLRSYPLKVQDRVIRLEERLRLQALAPAQWHAQIYRLSEDQLIGLRFASDDEVVELAKQALEHNLNRKQIKERIKSWRADEWRVGGRAVRQSLRAAARVWWVSDFPFRRAACGCNPMGQPSLLYGQWPARSRLL